MRLVNIKRATDLELARDLPASGANHMPLLRKGAILTERYIKMLSEQGINAVWVEDALSEGINPENLISDQVKNQAASEMKNIMDQIQVRPNALAGEEISRQLENIVSNIISNLLDSPDATLAIVDLANSDDYTHRHSVNVTALGLMIGKTMFQREGWVDRHGKRRYDRIDSRLLTLGMGLLLHDIGKMIVPKNILMKPGPLTDEEWVIMKEHPEAGVKLLESDNCLSYTVRSIIRDHHERWDGKGYPRQLAGNKINQLVRIASVADVYEACVSERPYKGPMPADKAYNIIVEGSGTVFDPDVVKNFQRIVFPYQLGTEIELLDGRSAIVSHVDASKPFEPQVRVPDNDSYTEFSVKMPEKQIITLSQEELEKITV